MKNVSQYHPGLPSTIPATMAQEIRHLWDRLNYVLGQIDELKEVPRGTSTEQLTQQVGGLQVALQAVQDSLTTGRTFVAFGESQPVGDTTSVAIAGASNGLTFAGTSSALTFTVTGAATFRAAIGAPAAASIVATTLTLAKITGGGADGSLTLSSEGVVTAYVAPT